MDVDSDIPESVRAWDPSVRRPTNPPPPSTYHQVIDPRFIFEIDITDTAQIRPTDAHALTIFVVPPRCCYCRSVHQACSRGLPSCARCTQAGQECVPVMDGYDTLPRPKIGTGLALSNGSGNRNPTRAYEPSRSSSEPELGHAEWKRPDRDGERRREATFHLWPYQTASTCESGSGDPVQTTKDVAEVNTDHRGYGYGTDTRTTCR
ncbi:hypothetical protein EDC04DRAFT_1699329 [Pisolithus marmoratus]|nr:hypothetical protein EDC04DRAFT_1699329 [Pisolithus marmoratus]